MVVQMFPDLQSLQKMDINIVLWGFLSYWLRKTPYHICWDRLYSHILSRVDELQTDDIVTIRGYINALDLAEDLDLKTALQMCVAYNVSDDELIVQEILEIIDSVVA